MYRLKGLAYLRSEIIKKPDHQINDKTTVEQQLNVLKAATNFQKALGNRQGDKILKMYKKMKKEKRLKLRKIDESTEWRKVRATFVNFRRKVVGGLVDDTEVTDEDERSNDGYSEE